MTEVLHSSCSSSPSAISTPHNPFSITQEETKEKTAVSDVKGRGENQLSLIALLATLFRKSFMMACKNGSDGELCSSSNGKGLEISWPTDVQHVAHVTFDRFNGFRGLPVEFEPEVHKRAPSASVTVFGVSTESMQLSFDTRGNSVPTILLLMQNRLYDQGGLQAEGIFRITGGNSQEEYVRDHLNRGTIPDGIDVHCLAGLIKAWFRELPRGILDSLSPEDVMQCQTPEDCIALVRSLPPTEADLLDWTINLMADVVLHEHFNKMNSRNIAMVFAPNMTQMVDPLTALMYAVQVMNFLKTLIETTLEERQESSSVVNANANDEDDDDDDTLSVPQFDLTDHEDENHSLLQLFVEDVDESDVEETEHVFVVEEPDSDDLESNSDSVYIQLEDVSDGEFTNYFTTTEESESGSCETSNMVEICSNITEEEACSVNDDQSISSKSDDDDDDQEVDVNGSIKRKEVSILSELIEAWR